MGFERRVVQRQVEGLAQQAKGRPRVGRAAAKTGRDGQLLVEHEAAGAAFRPDGAGSANDEIALVHRRETAERTFGGEDGRAQVVKIDTDTFGQVDEITLDPGESDLTSAVIDPSGSFAYFGANTQPGRIVRIDLGRFERTGAITLQGPGEGDLYGEDYPQSAVIAPTGEYAYFGLATFPGRVARIHLPGPDCTLPPWLSVDPMDGTVAAGESGTASVGFDATGLAPGEYGATLCFDSNDPSTPQLPVPISLTVIPATPPDRIFSDGFDGTEP